MNSNRNSKDLEDFRDSTRKQKKSGKTQGFGDSDTALADRYVGGRSSFGNVLPTSHSAGAIGVEETTSPKLHKDGSLESLTEVEFEGSKSNIEVKKPMEIVLEPEEYIKHWKRQKPAKNTYGYFSLFRFSDCLDKAYIFVGLIAAILGGLCVPLLIVIFGEMVRAMVIVFRVRNYQDCLTRNITDNISMLGNVTTCRKFYDQCLKQKPFENQTLPLNWTLNNTDSLDYITYETMHAFALEYASAAGVFTICSSIYFMCWHLAGDNQIIRIRKKYFEALLRKDMTWFETQQNPDAVNKLMDHTKGIWIGIGENIPIAINIVVTAIACFFTAFIHGWQLASLCLIEVVIMVLTTWLVNWTNSHKLVAELQAYKTANSLAEEILTNIRTVVFFGGQKKEFYRYKKSLKINSAVVVKWILSHSGSIFLLWTLNFLMWAIIIWFALVLVIYDHNCKHTPLNFYEYDAGDVIVIILCTIFGVGNIYMIIPILSAIKIAKGYGQKVFKVIDRKSIIDGMDDDAGMKIPTDEFLGGIEFDDVRFTYPNGREDVVLNHLNLKIHPSSKVAILGLNGCGKSTILKLICKEYFPDSGFIKIDGVDIRDLNTKWLRSQIGVVPQHADFFDDTIEANVRMGKLDAGFLEIIVACQCANAHDFIVSFNQGYQTRMGTGGQKLSSGQEQRLSIARALLRNPKLLFLDEPTTNLDIESAAMVIDTLKRIAKDRTVILVTHRLHLATDVDYTFVIKRGRVADKGVHSQLVKNQGPYRQLASGDFDKPSTSVRRGKILKAFDVSDISAVHFMNMFATKSFFPNIYADLSSVDPVGSRCSSLLMKHVAVRQGERIQLKSSVNDEDEEEDVHYTLELKDSVVGSDALLTPSESMFKTKPEDPNPYAHARRLKLNNAKSKVEGLADIMNPKRFSFSQVLWLTTKSTYKFHILISILAACALGWVLPLFGVFYAYTIEIMSDASAIPQNWKWATRLGDNNEYRRVIFALAILGLYAGFTACFQEFFLSMASNSMIKYLRIRLFAAILKQDLSFFENPANSVASLRELLASNVLTLRYLLYGFYGNFIQGIVILVAAVTISVFRVERLGPTRKTKAYTEHLTGYGVAMAVGIGLITALDQFLQKKQQLVTVQSLNEISDLILQVFSGKQQVTIMQLEPYFLDKFNTIQIESIRLRRRISYVRVFTFGLSQTAVFLAFSLFIYLAADEIVHNGATFTTVITIAEMFIFGTIAVGMNFATLPSFQLSVRAGESILGVLNREPTVPSYGGDELQGECSGHLSFHDVHFWYPFSSENPILKGINFSIQSGTTVAIVGSSESGKTAFVDIIVKFYGVSSGYLTLDGKEVSELNAVSLRQQMGYVDKLPQLFNRTVAENIAYGDQVNEVTMSRIVDVAKKLHMHNFFCSLPDGYETRLGGGMDRLSTAQKHRIMIARAMLRNPKILLIDEAQTSLDHEGERLVHESIEEARKDRTTIIIAHRLTTVQHVDLIVVMNDGFKVEMGTHAELMKIRHGEYGKLWRSQNPLDDESFSSGESWLGVAVSKEQIDEQPTKPVYRSSRSHKNPPPPPSHLAERVGDISSVPPKQEDGKSNKEATGWCSLA